MSRYIGARYVPLPGGAWDNTREYEPLTMVQYEGDTYTSKMYVPVGVAITNTTYWVKTSDFSQQVANLAQSLQQTDNRVQDIEGDIEDINRDLGALFDSAYFIKEFTNVAPGAIVAPTQQTERVDISKEGYTPIALQGYASDFTIMTTGINYANANWFPTIANYTDATKSGSVIITVLYAKNM